MAVDNFPIGKTFNGGYYVVTEHIAGERQRGRYRAKPEDPDDRTASFLVTLGTPQEYDLHATNKRLDMAAPSVAVLRSVASLETSGGRYDGCIEEEPEGSPIRGRDASNAVAMAFAIELCDALVEAKDYGAVLRGIRPELVYADVEFRLTGIAPRCEPFLYTATPTSQGVTHVFDQLYTAPEILLTREPDYAADVFSVGAIVSEMLTGEHPFPGAGWDQLEAIVAGRRAPFAGPPALGAIIESCLAVDPAARPSIEYLAESLRAAQSERAIEL